MNNVLDQHVCFFEFDNKRGTKVYLKTTFLGEPDAAGVLDSVYTETELVWESGDNKASLRVDNVFYPHVLRDLANQLELKFKEVKKTIDLA